ncbi:tRNA dimethylallyltransferase [Gossypium arboreum]|uniref:tRNA dimethylallyltransferase n=1 Tax=Gossypium arboreum TaxID=29729 RepID=A0A0B0NQY1_GOSAR|nr:tRNA dimethylallyltransferase [Gossypium arboreum]
MLRPPDSQSKTCLGHVSAKSSASVRHVWDMHQHAYMRASVRPCLGHGIGTYMVSMSNELKLENMVRVDGNDVIKLT